MRVAIVGSRGLSVTNLEKYLPNGVTEIVSGGAKGIDTCAREYAVSNGIKLTEFLPEYQEIFGSEVLRPSSLEICFCLLRSCLRWGFSPGRNILQATF